MQETINQLIIISGPTSTGKTKTSIAIAQNLKKEFNRDVSIVNFDSLLFYHEISIGTAKPTVEEKAGIEHFMIDIESIKNPINAAQFIKLAENLIYDLFKKNKIVILVGGSAFYLRSLLKGMYQSSPATPEIKDKLEKLYKQKGIDPFIEYLKSNDPESLLQLHLNDHYRLIRAVEHFEMNHSKISLIKNQHDKLNPYDFSNIPHPWNILHLYLDLPKDEHYRIIVNRTKQMFASGLMDEIEGLYLQGFTLLEKPLSSIGYKEAIEFRKGIFANVEECIERISISTRQLAKSQRTFFNKITPKESFNSVHDQDKIIKRAESFIRTSI